MGRRKENNTVFVYVMDEVGPYTGSRVRPSIHPHTSSPEV